MPQEPFEMGQQARFSLETMRPCAIFLRFLAVIAGRQSAEPSWVAGSEGKGQRALQGRGDRDGAPWGGGDRAVGSRERLCSPSLPKKAIHRDMAFPVELSLCRDCPSPAAQQEPLPAGARDRALPVGCHLSASPGASGTDPAPPAGPLPAGKLLCSDPAMHSKSAAGKERAKLLFWPGMC